MEQNKNNTPESKKPEIVSIKNAKAETLFKNVKEFRFLESIHKKFLEDVGNKKMDDLKGQTTIGNVFCLSSGYVGNKLGQKPTFEKVLDVFSDLFESKNGDVSSDVKTILKAFEKAEREGKERPSFKVLSAIFDITENDYKTAEELA